MALALVLIGVLGTTLEAQRVGFSGIIVYVDGSNFGDPLEDGSVEHPFNSIQEGVDAANPGDTVQVAPWTYPEHVIVDKNLILIGEDATTTIIDGDGWRDVVVEIVANNVEIKGFTIQDGEYQGILISDYNSCRISGNTLTNNGNHGIYIFHSNNNTITDNIMISNNMSGIWLSSSSNNNTVIRNTISNNPRGVAVTGSNNSEIYRNNVMDNTKQVNTFDSFNTVWEGNYWSNYSGEDLDGDGVGETPHVIDGTNQDNYPHVNPWPQVFKAVWESIPYDVSTLSNSTVTSFSFSQPDKRISFNVTRPLGTSGFCNVTIPKTLLDGPYVVTVDDLPVAPSPLEVSNDTHSFIYFTYSHSTHKAKIVGTTVIPEIPSLAIVPLFMAATLMATLLLRWRRKRKYFNP